MSRTIALILAAFFSITSYGQTFEGKIVYMNSYKSKIPDVTDEQFTTMMGSKQEYYIKKGDYITSANGSAFQWQLYINKDNKLYTKMSDSDVIYWNDGAMNTDEILKTELNKAVTEILGYTCDELILTCKSGIQKYYFNTKLSVDPILFTNHKYGNWYDFLIRSHSLPLRFIIENEQFVLESIAIEQKQMSVATAFFELPAGAKTMKSPF